MIQKKYQEIIKGLERNIEDQKELEYVKEQFSDFTVYFLNIINNMQNNYEKRISNIENKFQKVEDKLNYIEKELFDEMENLETVNCPYCDYSFMMEVDEQKEEIECPECGNLIELDWEDLSEDDIENDDSSQENNSQDDDM